MASLSKAKTEQLRKETEDRFYEDFVTWGKASISWDFESNSFSKEQLFASMYGSSVPAWHIPGTEFKRSTGSKTQFFVLDDLTPPKPVKTVPDLEFKKSDLPTLLEAMRTINPRHEWVQIEGIVIRVQELKIILDHLSKLREGDTLRWVPATSLNY